MGCNDGLKIFLSTSHSLACVACMLHMSCSVFWYLPSCLSSRKLFWGLHKFWGIHCDPSHHVLFGVPERLVHLGDKWHEICDHHLLPYLSKVHFHPCCSTLCPAYCVPACISEFLCWHLVVVAFSIAGGVVGFSMLVGCPVDLGHSESPSLFLQWLY